CILYYVSNTVKTTQVVRQAVSIGATGRVRARETSQTREPPQTPETGQIRGTGGTDGTGAEGRDLHSPPHGPMDRYIDSRPARRRRRLAFAAAALIVLAVAAAAYVRFGLTRSVVVNADRLVISSVKSDIFDEYVPATGRVAPRTTAYLDAVEG